MALLCSKPCPGFSSPQWTTGRVGMTPRASLTPTPASLPLAHSAPANTCLHSPLNIPGTQAALHWPFSPAETILPRDPSQAHTLLQVFALISLSSLTTSLNMLLPATHLHTPDSPPTPHTASLPPSSHLFFFWFIFGCVGSLLLSTGFL